MLHQLGQGSRREGSTERCWFFQDSLSWGRECYSANTSGLQSGHYFKSPQTHELRWHGCLRTVAQLQSIFLWYFKHTGFLLQWTLTAEHLIRKELEQVEKTNDRVAALKRILVKHGLLTLMLEFACSCGLTVLSPYQKGFSAMPYRLFWDKHVFLPILKVLLTVVIATQFSKICDMGYLYDG